MSTERAAGGGRSDAYFVCAAEQKEAHRQEALEGKALNNNQTLKNLVCCGLHKFLKLVICYKFLFLKK